MVNLVQSLPNMNIEFLALVTFPTCRCYLMFLDSGYFEPETLEHPDEDSAGLTQPQSEPMELESVGK